MNGGLHARAIARCLPASSLGEAFFQLFDQLK
jgi:hypothetical protein